MILCFSLSTIENGIITYMTSSNYTGYFYYYGNTATYHCYPGYELTGGDTVRTCIGFDFHIGVSVGQWNGTAPNCASKDKHI